MKKFGIVLCLIGALSAGASEPVLFNWDAGTLVEKVSGPGSHTVGVIQGLSFDKPVYALTGTVKYEGVTGDGYLEMWSHFADGAQYFSRTMADMGPLQKITGSSEERPFVLPFDPMGQHPAKLVIKVVLPGEGTVELKGLQLVQAKHFNALMKQDGAWWGPATAGVVFGSLGAVFGCLCGLFGWLAGRGKARSLVLCFFSLCIVLGVVSLGAGIYALTEKQPYDVVYPLFLFGGLVTVICFVQRKQAAARYANAELDRMSVIDQT